MHRPGNGGEVFLHGEFVPLLLHVRDNRGGRPRSQLRPDPAGGKHIGVFPVPFQKTAEVGVAGRQRNLWVHLQQDTDSGVELPLFVGVNVLELEGAPRERNDLSIGLKLKESTHDLPGGASNLLHTEIIERLDVVLPHLGPDAFDASVVEVGDLQLPVEEGAQWRITDRRPEGLHVRRAGAGPNIFEHAEGIRLCDQLHSVLPLAGPHDELHYVVDHIPEGREIQKFG
eukprot:351315_1